MQQLPPEELQGHLLDAIAACWVKRYGIKEGIVFDDTFQEILKELNGRALSWAGLGALTLIDVNWSDIKMWKLLRTRFGAEEKTLGVLTFSEDQVTTALQRRDHLWSIFPAMVETIEKILPTLPKLPELPKFA